MKKELFENTFTDIDDTFIDEATGSSKAKKEPKKSVLLVAAVIMTLLLAVSITASALSPVDLSAYLGVLFHGNYNVIGDMVSMPEYVYYHSSGDEIKVELKGILGDCQSAIIFYDVTVLDHQDPDPENAAFMMDTDISIPFSADGFTTAGTTLSLKQNPDNSWTYSMSARLKQTNFPKGKMIVVEISGIKVLDKENSKAVTVISGNWSMAFKLDYEDITTTVPCDIDISPEMLIVSTDDNGYTKKIDMHIEEIRVSPISMLLTATTTGNIDDEGPTKLYNAGLLCDDGTCILFLDYNIGNYITVPCVDLEGWRDVSKDEVSEWVNRNHISGISGSSHYDNKENITTKEWILSFSSELDVDKVIAVFFGGEIIPLNSN